MEEDKYLNKEGLELYNQGINEKLETLNDNDITNFSVTKPNEEGLFNIQANKNDGSNMDVLSIYNGIDGKYPYTAFGSQSAKELNDRVKALEESGGSGTDVPVYVYDGNRDSDNNKNMLDKIIELIDNRKPFILLYEDMYKSSAPSEICIKYDRKVNNNECKFYFIRTGISQGVGYGVGVDAIIESFIYKTNTRTFQSFSSVTNSPIMLNYNTSANLVTKNNTTEWVPAQDYGLVHKKYVDDAISNVSFTETDPTVPSYVKSISQTDISNWNNKVDKNVNDLANYYNKVNSYSKSEIDTMIGNASTLLARYTDGSGV